MLSKYDLFVFSLMIFKFILEGNFVGFFIFISIFYDSRGGYFLNRMK